MFLFLEVSGCFDTELSVCLFQDEADSQHPVFRDNHQLYEEVKGWLKDQKVQEIFMQGKLFLSSFQ